MRLRNLLPDDSKYRRNRRILLNVQISFFVWILEFMLGCLGVLVFFVMPFNSSRAVDIVCLVFYTIVVPGAYLINDPELKSKMVDSRFYILFTNTVAHNYMNQIIPRERDNQDP